MYMKKYEQLSTDQIESIEQDILKGKMNFKELSIKYGVFDHVIRKVAADMGLDFNGKEQMSTTPVAVVSSVVSAPKTKSTSTKNVRKKRTILTDYQKALVRDAYVKNAGVRGIKTELCKKFNIAATTLDRIIESVVVKQDEVKEKEAVAAAAKEELVAKAKIVEDVTPAPVKKEEEPAQIVLLSNYTNIKTMLVRLDCTNTGSTEPIFENDLQKYKPSFDFEGVIKEWFEKNVKGKKINLIEILYKVSGNDANVVAYLVKYAMMYNVNLNFITTGGMKRDIIISEFGETSVNIQRVIGSSQDAAKYVLRTDYNKLRTCETVYTLHVIYTGSKAIYVADTTSKVYDLLADLCETQQDSAFKIVVYKLTNGKQEQLTELKSATWI